MRNNKGFTLVELSIVLVIIGLLVGGILAAKTIIDSARNVKTVKLLEQLHMQINSFNEQYRYLPGDLPNAYALFGAACGADYWAAGWSTDGCNGDGDGAIGWGWMNGGHESWVAERHLWLAGFLPQEMKHVGTTGGSYTPGSSVLELPYNKKGGIIIQSPDLNYGNPYANGEGYLLWMGTDSPTSGCQPNCIPALTAMQALALDKKIDDGVPTTGSIFAPKAYGGGAEFNNCVRENSYSTTNTYNTADTSVSCVLENYRSIKF